MIRVQDLAKEFVVRGDRARALHNVSFEVAAGEFFTLLGPSGCGKSTTLRCVAGLERPDSGTIEIGGRTVSGHGRFVPPNERPVGMVFQHYAIWPHMTVAENVAFPLRYRKKSLDRSAVRTAVEAALRVVRMEDFAERDAPYLSGGQQQRVALARAVIGDPEVLLLDEPLSNLDARLRTEMRDELRRISKQIGITTLYVTHDQSEALALSDRIAVMHGGRVHQIGNPTEIYRRPVSRTVGLFVGDSNFLDVEVIGSGEEPDELAVRSELGVFRARSSGLFGTGARVMMMVRPDALRRAPDGRSREGWNHLTATVTASSFVGEAVNCRLRAGKNEITARLPSYEDISIGDTVQLRFRPEWTWLLPPEPSGDGDALAAALLNDQQQRPEMPAVEIPLSPP